VVYALLGDRDELLYIGKSQEPTWRWQQHRRLRPWWDAVQQIAVLVMSDSRSAYVTEQRLIRQLQPQHNIQGR
jgi:excinuclease UvrABC nuclease subunit